MLPETKSQDSGLGGINHHCCDDGGRYLRVPVGGEMLSGSPSADSVISGHSMCSSGGPSTGEYALPVTANLSSSSSSDELDIDLTYSDILSEFGPQRSASATDSMGGPPTIQEKRRLSLTRMTEEEDASRRSKSLDGDETVGNMIARHFANKEGAKTSAQPKSHKTPWGKVKDIIQTRKDSLKQRQHRNSSHGDSLKRRQRRTSQRTDARDVLASSDHDEDAPVFDAVETTPEDADASCEGNIDGTKSSAVKSGVETTGDARRHKSSTTSLSNYQEKALQNRRLTPMLTITLPSTEELRHLNTRKTLQKCSSKPPPSPQSEERLQKLSGTTHPVEELVVGKSECRQQFGTPVNVSSSPPAHRRSSKWTKVKNAFLTSSVPGNRDAEAAGQLSVSGPSSPNRHSSFFCETDPEELSGGELTEVLGDDDDRRGSNTEPKSLQAEIQRNYEELQQKLSQEFHKKLNEWERMKASATSSNIGRTSTIGAAGAEENYHHDKGFRRKMEEWERMKSKEGLNSVKRESVALQPLDEDSLSPHFRKKLHEWQRIKKALPREENHPSRKKLVEWQLWRTGSGKQGHGGSGSEDQDDFNRKLQEWERMKSASPCESPTSKEAAMDSDRNSTGAKTPSPGVVRKDSTGHVKKKAAGGNATTKPTPKAKTQKEKELQWLEKELQKIGREKQRLEREREKYLERESRLEKMRKAVGSSAPGKQEVLIQTSTGFFRFQGISEKFTRRLYEWEKARGIAPEASTFALLDPGYRPTGERHGGPDVSDNGGLTRSKSASSVTNMAGGSGLVASMSHQQSSLSLNDVEGLEKSALADGRASSDPQLHDDDEQEDDEPAAVIVDVEDVIEETAALLVETPAVQSQTPVYCYAPEEVTRLIDSSGSESERDSSGLVRRTDSVRTESSYKLIEENMHLLSKLQIKGDICRKLETELGDLEEKIDHVTKTHEKELERLRQEETEIQELNNARAAVHLDEAGTSSGIQEALVDALRTRIQELERRQERLRREGVSLQDSFVEHSEQQAALAQNLVGKMKQLQEVNSNMSSHDQEEQYPDNSCLTGSQEDAVALVQELSTQLLTLAEKLEIALGERNREIHSLRFELEDRRRSGSSARLSRGLSSDGPMSVSLGSLMIPSEVNLSPAGHYLPRQTSVELTELPSLLTHKVLELKQGLNYLCAATESQTQEATFLVKLSPKNRRRRVSKHAIEAPVVTTQYQEESSPPCVTITPAFLRRQQKVEELSQERETPHVDTINLPDEMEDRISANPSQEDLRESFCSARSSSESSSVGRGDDPKEKSKSKSDSNIIDKIVDDDLVPIKKMTRCEEVTDRKGPTKNFKLRRASDSRVAYKRDTIDPKTASHDFISTSSTMKGIDSDDMIGCVPASPQSSQGDTTASAVNVFVPTTRKIFSPVRRDSKGKASSVIGYVVEEENEPQDDPTENNAVIESTAAKPIAILPTTPQWMIMRSRSQSASPALPRRRLSEENWGEGNGNCQRGFRFSPEKASADGGRVLKVSKGSNESVKELFGAHRKMSVVSDIVIEDLSEEAVKIDPYKELMTGDKRELLFNTSRPTTPLGFPPLPPSPSPGRRDLFKQIAKDTAPSIRMMIAKYNQKLTEQDGGRSPEVSGSGAGSPVAWRSPVAERRVRTQMAKYQEEVQRVLQQGSRKIGRMGYGEVQKSASAGVIRSPTSSQGTPISGSVNEQIGSPCLVRRGILKSSSAGSIKPVNSPPIAMPTTPEPKPPNSNITPSDQSLKLIALQIPSKETSDRFIVTPVLTQTSPKLIRSAISTPDVESPQLPRLRALRLQRAKEEFLTRGPGGRSWTSDGDTSLTNTSTPSASISSEPVWTKNVVVVDVDTAKNRNSQISVGSESSYGSQIQSLSPEEEDDDERSLMKSASAGMINVDTKTYKKFTNEIGTDSLPRTSKEKTNSHNKFGISTITSKFRKVKMRKNKEKEKEGVHKVKMNTVSLLCRQSLLVDINKREGNGSGEGPSTSKSCPSSPVLQRTTSTENNRNTTGNQGTGSWIMNPARKIFKPK